jgi:uncharacterized protein DUF4384
MFRARMVSSLAVGLLCMAGMARAGGGNGLDVELWTNRGQDAVYQPGDPLEVKVKTSDDAYLLVYEIDAVGNVRLIAPEWGARGFVPGGETFQVPSPHSDMELVVDGPVGQGFLVAIASRDPFRPLPWYLRPYNAQADDIGYQGRPDDDQDDEDDVTSDGKIVGDPFVAMERIRRRVLAESEDEESFATSYTSYYVHHAVRYPRYICNDCHRPNAFAWWDGFDPYYATCSVVDFRINWAWAWGPGYWGGSVPYYYYVVRPDCPPRYRMFSTHDACFSSWDGRRRWNALWGDALHRGKTAPPPGYVPPTKYDGRTIGMRQPPGFLGGGRTLSDRRAAWMPSGREIRNNDGASRGDRSSRGDSRGERAGGLMWRQRNGDPGGVAGRDGRAEVGGGRQDASAPGQGRGNGKDWIFRRDTPRPSYERPRDLPRPSYDGPRERPRDLPRPSYDGPRERPRASEMPLQRSRPNDEGRSGWSRERSQPRYEAPRSEPAHERPQPKEAPQRVEHDRGQDGGHDRGGDDGGGPGRGRGH